VISEKERKNRSALKIWQLNSTQRWKTVAGAENGYSLKVIKAVRRVWWKDTFEPRV